MSPVWRLWFFKLIEFVDVLTPSEVKTIGFTKIDPVKLSLEILILDDVPIPTDKPGSTTNEILSPVSNWCSLNVTTSVSIFSTSQVTSLSCDSNKKLSLSPFVRLKKVISSSGVSLTFESWVLIPIVLTDLGTTNNVSGISNEFAPLSSDITMFVPAGFVN